MTPDHGELLYEGKAKRVFASTDPEYRFRRAEVGSSLEWPVHQLMDEC